MTPTQPEPTPETKTPKDLLDWAESIICNASSLTDCTQAEADAIVKKWRDEKHAMFPDGAGPKPDAMTDLETALLHLIVILPMAKGYASANPVGNNWKMVEEAYAFANELNERPAHPSPASAEAAASLDEILRSR